MQRMRDGHVTHSYTSAPTPRTLSTYPQDNPRPHTHWKTHAPCNAEVAARTKHGQLPDKSYTTTSFCSTDTTTSCTVLCDLLTGPAHPPERRHHPSPTASKRDHAACSVRHTLTVWAPSSKRVATDWWDPSAHDNGYPQNMWQPSARPRAACGLHTV